jgi:hypothetical protein
LQMEPNPDFLKPYAYRMKRNLNIDTLNDMDADPDFLKPNAYRGRDRKKRGGGWGARMGGGWGGFMVETQCSLRTHPRFIAHTHAHTLAR